MLSTMTPMGRIIKPLLILSLILTLSPYIVYPQTSRAKRIEITGLVRTEPTLSGVVFFGISADSAIRPAGSRFVVRIDGEDLQEVEQTPCKVQWDSSKSMDGRHTLELWLIFTNPPRQPALLDSVSFTTQNRVSNRPVATIRVPAPKFGDRAVAARTARHPYDETIDPAIFTEQQRNALDEANRFRAIMKLPPFKLHPVLSKASQGHADYLEKNRVFEHTESQSGVGFLGVHPSDRAKAVGYPNGCAECISGSRDPVAGINGLIYAPYHRTAFMNPAPTSVGIGINTHVVVNFDSKDKHRGIVVYPVDGQEDVPCNWSGGESPNPLRIHGISGPVGYVVSMIYFSGGGPSKLKVQEAGLYTAEGNPVPCYVNTPDKDEHLPNGVFLIPKKALKSGERYQAVVRTTTENGVGVNRNWSFVTEEPVPDCSVRVAAKILPSTPPKLKLWFSRSSLDSRVTYRLRVVWSNGVVWEKDVSPTDSLDEISKEIDAETLGGVATVVPLWKGKPLGAQGRSVRFN